MCTRSESLKKPWNTNLRGKLNDQARIIFKLEMKLKLLKFLVKPRLTFQQKPRNEKQKHFRHFLLAQLSLVSNMKKVRGTEVCYLLLAFEKEEEIHWNWCWQFRSGWLMSQPPSINIHFCTKDSRVSFDVDCGLKLWSVMNFFKGNALNILKSFCMDLRLFRPLHLNAHLYIISVVSKYSKVQWVKI